MSSPAPFPYRPDIDGLRGIAVLLVVLFHAQLSCKGGFIGVDVFFVISGYLITGLMLKDLEAGTFRLAYFWERRVRRIMPAVMVMTLAVLALGMWLMLPNELSHLGKSVLAQVLMVANLYFWKEGGGYFAGPAEEMPLLHTWSLAVEEQFYLLMPPLCLLLRGWHARRAGGLSLRGLCLRVFAVIFAVSLAASVVMVRIDAHWAFYWLPTRAWELLLGSMLACLPLGMRALSARKHGLLSALALGVIIAAALVYDEGTAFPGLAALPPCLAVGVLIWVGRAGEHSMVRRVLESRPLLHLGLISYSLYLWHWPLLAFVNYLSPVVVDADSRGVRVLVVLVSWGIAVLSWRWVEMPVRGRLWLKSRAAVFAAAMLGMGVLFSWGWLMREGLPGRIPAQALRFAAAEPVARQWPDTPEAVFDGRLPRFGSTAGPARVMLWGDSHAKSMVPAVAEWCAEKGSAGLLAAHSATAPVLGYHRRSRHGLDSHSQAWGEAVLETIRKEQIPDTILTALWSKCADKETGLFGAALVDTVRQLQSTGTRVWIVLDVPVHDFEPPKALAFHAMHPPLFLDPRTLGLSLSEHRAGNRAMEALVPELEAAGARVLDPAALLFDAEGRGLIEIDGDALYGDGDHLTEAGALLLKPLFAPVFER